MLFALLPLPILLWFMPRMYRAQRAGRKTESALWKAASTFLCLAAGVAGWIMGGGTYAALMVAGLAVCLAADIVLEYRFIAGMAVFFLGHALYVTAMFIVGAPSLWTCVFAALGLAVLVFFLLRWKDKVAGQMPLPPFCAYMVALAALLGAGFTFLTRGLTPFAVCCALGSVLFVASDVTLVRNMFIAKTNRSEFVSLSMYYMGQLLLALSCAAFAAGAY